MNNKNIRDRHKNNDIDIENGIQESLEEGTTNIIYC